MLKVTRVLRLHKRAFIGVLADGNGNGSGLIVCGRLVRRGSRLCLAVAVLSGIFDFDRIVNICLIEIDIAPKGCSKGEGVQFLREYMRHEYGEIRLYGIGDSMNDLPLIEASDVSYTFPYAPKELQDRVTRVVPTIVEALEDSMRDEV